MPEQFSLRFKRGADQIYHWEGTRLEESGKDGSPQRCTEMKSKGRGWLIPDSSSGRIDAARIIALAFVRVAQWKFIRMAERPGTDIPIFADGPNAPIATKFYQRCRDAARRDNPDKEPAHQCGWLQEMFPLPSNPGETPLLSKWFSATKAPNGYVVNARRDVLPPTSVLVMIDGQEATEAELDRIETFLSFALNAGLPFHLESDGTTVTGRPPSIQPGWFYQEAESAEALEAYASVHTSILCVLGGSGSGKTVFATYWLRRLIANKQLRQKHVFCWSFNRQGVESYIPVPLISFFKELAAALGVQFGPTASVEEQATSIVRAMTAKPALLFLDGIEAAFCASKTDDLTVEQPEIPPGLATLLRGIAETTDSFILATSTHDFAVPFNLPKKTVHHLFLEKCSVQAGQDSLEEYATVLSAEGIARKSAPRAFSDKARRAASIADHRRMLKEISGCDSNKELDAWIETKQAQSSYAEGNFLTQSPQPLSASEIRLLNIFLSELQGRPEEILLHILCTCHHRIAADALLAAAAALPVTTLYRRAAAPSATEWDEALTALIALKALEQGDAQSFLSVHSGKRRFIADGLKKNKPLTWIAINKALAEYFLEHSAPLPNTHAELAPLIDAAIYLSQAGEKRRVYHDVGVKRLSRGLKGHTIFHLGEYGAPRAINHALLGDAGDAAISDLLPEEICLCIHVNALCLRFQNRLEDAFREDRKAWAMAKMTQKPDAILPIGFNMLRLCHIFGNLHEAIEVERTIMSIVWKTIGQKILSFLRVRKAFSLGDSLDKDDIVDGAGALSSMLALTQVYRGKSDFRVNHLTLTSGIKECRNNGADFKFLMPSYGRPWHALTLLEMGQWQTCAQAIESGEWDEKLFRYQQTGFFELLTAKTLLAKAATLTGNAKSRALASASESAAVAMAQAEKGAYRWWAAASSITQGQILAADAQTQEARQAFDRALQLSRASSFRLLTVDALLERARLASAAGRSSDRDRDASEALKLAGEIGYRLREPALRELVKAKR